MYIDKEKATIIAALITGFCGLMAAVIALGVPIVEKMVTPNMTPAILIDSSDSRNIQSTEIALQQTLVALQAQATQVVQRKSENNPATNIPVPESNNQPLSCIHPEVLAQQKGWENPWLVDSVYGGYNVTVQNTAELPSLWEANQFNSNNQKINQIHQYDDNRMMAPGIWIIYTPCGCRAKYGFYDC